MVVGVPRTIGNWILLLFLLLLQDELGGKVMVRTRNAPHKYASRSSVLQFRRSWFLRVLTKKRGTLSRHEEARHGIIPLHHANDATAVPQTFLQRQRVHDGKPVSRRHHFQRLTEL